MITGGSLPEPGDQEGEYRTGVARGPGFPRPLRLVRGAETLHSGYWFVDMLPLAEEG